ncbi:hypothetical protein MX763_003589 [Salmonella enterica subsp. enterica serovar Montevideo]|nr:hypothetical protein [Salmonella enterica subsp. enterica serovar Montevideo]HAK3958902.1 hypothetical protein [Salmonella enterica]HAK8959638.1 hypothetical protein [Salmonella enterica]
MAIKSCGFTLALMRTAPSRQPAGVRNGDLQKFSNETAEQSGQPDFWVLTGDYHLPQYEHSCPPWKACFIDKIFKTNGLLFW